MADLHPVALTAALLAYERNARLRLPVKSNVAAAIEAYIAAAPDPDPSSELDRKLQAVRMDAPVASKAGE